MTPRAEKPLVRGKSHSENLTFSALLCEKNLKRKKKKRQTTKQKNQEHRSIAPLNLQLRSNKKPTVSKS